MFLTLLFLCFLIIIETIVPPMITPFSYSMIGYILLNGISPRLLSVIVIGTSVGASILTRFFLERGLQKIRIYQEQKKHKDIISRFEKLIDRYFKEHRQLTTFGKKLEAKIHTNEGQAIICFLSILTLASAIPDFITIRIIRNKLHFSLFILAAVLGKALAYLPIIFFGKGILTLLGK